MFKKLLIATVVFASASSLAIAGHSYKGEKDYKGEMPCPVNAFMAAPYVGFSLGSRNNYSGSPAVFRGIDANLSLGYAAMMNPAWYLAGEIFGLGTFNVKNAPSSPRTTLFSTKSNWGWGVSLIPGYLITDTVLGYLRLGANATHFNDVSTTKWGWHVGPGLQFNLNQNWDMRAEYVVTYYGSVGQIGHTASDVANLGLNYRFM